MWKRIRQFIIRQCDKYLTSRNWHYWEPVWDARPATGNMTFNTDPEVNEDEVQWYAGSSMHKWPPDYHGHKCRCCGQVKMFKGIKVSKRLKSRGCSKLPS